MSTESRDYEYGRIVSVDLVEFGDVLTADTATGATALVLEDAADFDETGGQLTLGDIIYTYSAVDDETGTITLATATLADAVEGDAVKVYDPNLQAVSTEKVALVEVRGDHGNVDMLMCQVSLHLVDQLAEGVRGGRGESVKLELDGPDWVVVDVLGQSSAGSAGDGSGSQLLAEQDSTTVALLLDSQSILLKHVPVLNSEHVYWNGVYQPGSEWTRAGQTVTIPDPTGLARIGDELVCEYLYTGVRVDPADPSAFVVGSTEFDPAEGFNTIDLPAATQAGDIIVLGIVGQNVSDFAADSRIVYLAYAGTVPGFDGPWGGVAILVADDSGDPIGFGVESGFGNRTSALTVFRCTEIARKWTLHDPAPDPSFNITPPSSGVYTINAMISLTGTVSDDPDAPSQSGATWADSAYQQGGGKATVRISYSLDHQPASLIGITDYSTGTHVGVLTLGVL